MKQSVKVALLASVVSGIMLPMHGHAGGIPVVDAAANASLTAQIVQGAEEIAAQAKDYAMQGAQYVSMLESYANAVENTVEIPAAAIARVQSLVYRTEAIANQAALITGPDGTMMERFRAMKSVGGQAGNLPGNTAQQAEWLKDQWSRQLDEDTRLAGLEYERGVVANQIMDTASDNSASAIGRMAAIQAQSQVVAASGKQMQQTSAILTQMFEHTIVKDQREAAERKLASQMMTDDTTALREVIAAGPPVMTSNPITW